MKLPHLRQAFLYRLVPQAILSPTRQVMLPGPLVGPATKARESPRPRIDWLVLQKQFSEWDRHPQRRYLQLIVASMLEYPIHLRLLLLEPPVASRLFHQVARHLPCRLLDEMFFYVLLLADVVVRQFSLQ